jgi:transcriptional antiterminator RfaH
MLNLLNQGYEAWFPTLKQRKKTSNKTMNAESIIEVPMFPRYVLCRPTCESQAIFPVRYTKGVSSFMAVGRKLATIPHTFVNELVQVEQMQDLKNTTRSYGLNSDVFVGPSHQPLLSASAIANLNGAERAILFLHLIGESQPSD